MSEICLILVCGIPASGKTTFINKLKLHIKNYCLFTRSFDSTIFTVCFDEIMPVELEKDLFYKPSENIESTATSASDLLLEKEITSVMELSNWKTYRRNILKCVDALIQRCMHKTIELDINADVLDNFLKTVSPSDDFLYQDRLKKLIFVDDNFYYKSMRYEYYQLARKYQTGFCQFFLSCSLKTAISRNDNRSEKVTNNVIHAMVKKFEPPSSSKDIWEEKYLHIDTESNIDFMPEAIQLILTAIKNPAPPFILYDLENKDISRTITFANIFHQADQTLRKLVKDIIIEHKGNAKIPDLKKYANNVNLCRSQILTDLKLNKVNIPNDIVNTESTLNICLYNFLKPIFHQKLDFLNKCEN